MTTDNSTSPEDDLTFQKLNLETGIISWEELQRHFARGVVVIVAKELDLVEVAKQVSLNNTSAVQIWMNQNLLRHATDNDAINWNESQQEFWAVVTAPWVLVQIIT